NQIKEALLSWQPKKLYVGNFGHPEGSTLGFDIGTYSPLLGKSYTQFAVEGLARQTSQGTGGFRVSPGHRFTYYKRVDSVLAGGDESENDFFDGIDTTLPGFASRLGSIEGTMPALLYSLQ